MSKNTVGEGVSNCLFAIKGNVDGLQRTLLGGGTFDAFEVRNRLDSMISNANWIKDAISALAKEHWEEAVRERHAQEMELRPLLEELADVKAAKAKLANALRAFCEDPPSDALDATERALDVLTDVGELV
jgi:hypothetical protein